MESPTHNFRETDLVFELILESQIKSKAVMSCSSQRKKRTFFVPFFVFCPKEIFLTFVLVHGIDFQSIHTFTYQKTLLHILFCLFLKSSKAFSVSFNMKQFLGGGGQYLSNFNIHTAFKLTFIPNDFYPGGGCGLGLLWSSALFLIPNEKLNGMKNITRSQNGGVSFRSYRFISILIVLCWPAPKKLLMIKTFD